MSGRDRDVLSAAIERLLVECPPASVSPSEFLGARYDAGLAWVDFRTGFGGLGIPSELQSFVVERLESAGAPSPAANFVGVHQAAAAVHAYAPESMQRRLLRAAFTNDEFWCQMFSEPGAGSDLAGLSTSAVRDGDDWIVNGQKVWTSFAHRARWAIMLARSDPNQWKHRGLTFFIVDMDTAGIDVRPLRTMDGGRHFNEVFLSDVRVPDVYRLGEVGDGWSVAMHLLGAERQGIADIESPRQWLLDVWRRCDDVGRATRAADRAKVASVLVQIEVARLLASRVATISSPGHSHSLAPLVKLSRNLVDQMTGNAVVDLLGPFGQLVDDYDWETNGRQRDDSLEFLWTRETTIGGGTAEIMRNVIGERVLGLPADVRVDKDLPWREIPRS